MDYILYGSNQNTSPSLSLNPRPHLRLCFCLCLSLPPFPNSLLDHLAPVVGCLFSTKPSHKSQFHPTALEPWATCPLSPVVALKGDAMASLVWCGQLCADSTASSPLVRLFLVSHPRSLPLSCRAPLRSSVCKLPSSSSFTLPPSQLHLRADLQTLSLKPLRTPSRTTDLPPF